MFETPYLMHDPKPQLPDDLFVLQNPCKTLEILLANAFENIGNSAALDELNAYINEINQKGYVIMLDTHHEDQADDMFYRYTKYYIKDSLEYRRNGANVLKACICNEGYLILVRLITSNQLFLEKLIAKLDLLRY